jgi:glycerol-3-phosphate cytidylyltransferase-like family protein
LDTRTKILKLDEALELRLERPVVVTGYFDLLRAEHARALEEVRRRTGAGALLAAVMPWAEAYQSQRARAEMAAALRAVDYVIAVEAEPDVAALREVLGPVEVVRMEEADARRNRELVEHVERRNGS